MKDRDRLPDHLPNAEQARIDPRKLRDYALNPQHPSGRYKTAFFAQMGYTAANWQRLEHDIREQHLAQPAEPGQPSLFGSKYTITAPLQGAAGLGAAGDDRMDLSPRQRFCRVGNYRAGGTTKGR